ALGRIPEAETAYRAALKLNGRYADAQLNLAQVLHHQGRMAEAETQYREFLRLAPDAVPAHFRLGLTLLAQARPADAETAFRATLRLKPDFVEAHHNLGATLRAQNRPAEAEASYRAALRLRPGYAEALVNLGMVQHLQNRPEEAVASLLQALQINPRSAEAHNNLGIVYCTLDRLSEAFASCQEALRLKPGSAETYNNLFNIYSRRGQLDEALACYREASRLDPKHAAATYSAYLFRLNYHPNWTPAAIFEEHRRWGETYAPRPGNPPAHSNSPEPGRKLKIGYVSPDLRKHSVAYFIEPVLKHHDKNRFEVFAYAQFKEAKPDEVSERLRGYCDHWIETKDIDDLDLARRIREDGIDIVIELAGHTGDCRLPMLAYRPAPVQVSYLGYPNTTGLPAMDYRLTDEWADPPGQEAFHTERLVRLPRGFLCYSPGNDTEAAGELPAPAAGHITFGSFNMLPKITPQAVAAWARILTALPGARLVLKNKSLSDPGAAERYVTLFADQGIDSKRLELVSWLPSRQDHLAFYSRIDIALDTFPYNGTTTTCEALWMGVPVVALAGDRHAGRVGVSLLSRVGLTELIARTPEDYVRLAVDLANDTARLARLRVGLRERMKNSSLCDATGFNADLEQAYREMWRAWCGERMAS
ncbi:MAG: tetratricopeptide repeat protein, partial [Rhodocyclales bacterium]|nr:tetratricopeptide repeat protein [Rhodocyclales bacterium]